MRWITPTDNKYNSIGNFFIRCDTINSTSKSNRIAASGCDFDKRSYSLNENSKYLDTFFKGYYCQNSYVSD